MQKLYLTNVYQEIPVKNMSFDTNIGKCRKKLKFVSENVFINSIQNVSPLFRCENYIFSAYFLDFHKKYSDNQ